MPVRDASAIWEGTLTRGQGRMLTGSGTCEGRYSAGSRFESAQGSNPEELIGAAHAGCFSMALAGVLEEAGHQPEQIRTQAHVHIDKGRDGYTVTRIDLETSARVPGISEELFRQQAETAKQNCPVSRLLKAAEITLNANLEQ